jgi:acetyl-CoA decarbonylase/synthase complex subunit epsilon
MAKAWNLADVAGPKQARVTKPEIIAALVKKAKRPLLVVGAEILNDGVIDRVIEIGKKGIPIAATAHTIKTFLEKGFKPASSDLGVHEVTNLLKDPEWKGFDGKGNYDMVIFLGINYYLASRMLSTLKHFAPHLRAYSLDRYYHVNAEMSLENIFEDQKFLEALDTFINKL